jgi:hypothetical protein
LACAGPGLEQLLHLAPEDTVGVLACAAKFIDERVIRPRVDGIRGKDAGLPATGLDFCLQPFEVLTRRWRVGQHVDGLLDRQGADLLQPPPRPHAQVRRARG